MDPNGKVALVTGAGSGIGRATAIALAKAGASVAIADMDERRRTRDRTPDRGRGGKAAFVRIDVTKRDDLERMVSFAEETFGGLDILHNNAGIGTPPPRYPGSAGRSVGTHDRHRPLGRDRGHPGGGTSHEATRGRRDREYRFCRRTHRLYPDPIYAAVKHGVVGFSRSLTYLKDEANIRVNCVCPGVVNTPMIRKGMEGLSGEERAQREAFLNQMPLITPEEIADAVMEFVTDDSLNGEAMGVTYGRPRKLVPPAIRFQRDPAQR